MDETRKTSEELKILKYAGLTDLEIMVYCYLLGEKDALASEISEHLEINRSQTYTILKSLIKKGLVVYVIQEEKKYFSAANFAKIVNELIQMRNDVSDAIKKLPAIAKQLREKEGRTRVEIYSGKGGLKALFEDLLVAKEYCFIGYTGIGMKLLPIWYRKWNERRVIKKIRRKLLVAKGLLDASALNFPLTEIRHLPKQHFSAVSTGIYRDNVSIFVPLENDFVGIIIRDRKVAQSYLSHFKLLWKLAKK